MATNALNILLTLDDKLSASLKSAGQNFESFAQKIDRAGTQLARTGAKMVAVGTTMNAPFFVASKAMEKYSFDAQNAMIRLNNEFLSLSQVLASAAIPTINQFNDAFSRVINFLKALDPELLKSIAHWAMIVGGILIAAGTMEIFIGKIISLSARMATLALRILTFSNGVIPILIAVIGGLIFAWYKFHDEFVLVCDSLELLWLQWCKAVGEAWMNIVKLISKIPGFGGLSAEIKKEADAIAGIQAQIDALAMGKHGKLAGGIDTFGKTVQDMIDKIKEKIKGASTEIETVMKDLNSRMLDLANTFSDGFASAFDQVLFEGKSFSEQMKNLFKQMTRDILKDFLSTIGKNLFKALLGGQGMESGTGLGGLLAANMGGMMKSAGGGFMSALGWLGGLFFHNGGIVRAHNGLAADEVPIIAQSGEGILSRRGMAALGGSGNLRRLNSGQGAGGTTVNNSPVIVIQAWDTQDIMRNKKAIESLIVNSLSSNGSVRKAIKNYV